VGTSNREGGFALITMLILLALLMAMLLTHFAVTWIEMSTTRSSMRSFVGFYAAEAGLNVRAEQVRQTFVGYSLPSGTSPSDTDPCTGSNMGSGDFACVSYAFQERNVVTYVKEKTAGHLPIVIPRGETFGNLHGRENHYAVYSTASNSAGSPEAVLEVHFMSRDVPLFQFAAFYDNDLEILPSPDMSIEGPIHSNGDLYLGSDNTLDITHPVTAAGNLYRGRKDADSCMTGPVQVNDPDNLLEIPTCSGNRQPIVQSDVTAWNQMINVDVTPLTAPPPEVLDPVAGSTNWDHADLRVVLDLNSTPAIEIRNQDGSVDAGLSAALNACGAVGYSTTLENKREGSFIDMLEVEVDLLIDCVHASSLMGASGLDDTSDGGLVWYFTVDGPDSSVPNSYGVRVKDGTELVSSVGGAPAIEGMTVVTDQALYVQGNYNTANKKPAAFLADSINVLSNGWNDAASSGPLSGRVASATAIYAAFLAGTDSTGGAEGSAGQDSGGYNGGLENFLRLHEDWSSVTLTIRGSFVSLFSPRHVDGSYSAGTHFAVPVRDWIYEDEFDDANALPPLTPTFVYLKQELFVRQFEL